MFAYYFQNDSLLLPVNFPESEIEKGVPLELAKDFDNPDVFEIPMLDDISVSIIVVSVLPGTALPKNWKTLPVRQTLTMVTGGTILRACHIAQWRQTSLFCGCCGTKNEDGILAQDSSPHRCCPKCGRHEFPRICPAVIVVITDDKEEKIILAHNKKYRTGMYSHISGFNEAGETLEETVVREVREEIQIEIKDVSYIKSQPWPFPNSLMLGFKAHYVSGTIKPDGIEIEDAKWFAKDYILGQADLSFLPAEGSLSRFLINLWLAGTL